MRQTRSSKLWIWPTLWAAVIFATSCTVIHSRQFVAAVTTKLPIHTSPQRFASFWSGWWWVFVKGYHVLEFALLFLLARIWLRSTPAKRTSLLAFAATFLYAASDEFHQSFVADRGGRLTDVLIDAAGAGCAWLIVVAWNSAHGRGQPAT